MQIYLFLRQPDILMVHDIIRRTGCNAVGYSRNRDECHRCGYNH